MQLRAGYRPEADLREKREAVLRAIEVTERQHALIRQKAGALSEMQAHLEDRLATFNGWLAHLDGRLAGEKAAGKKPKARSGSR